MLACLCKKHKPGFFASFLPRYHLKHQTKSFCIVIVSQLGGITRKRNNFNPTTSTQQQVQALQTFAANLIKENIYFFLEKECYTPQS